MLLLCMTCTLVRSVLRLWNYTHSHKATTSSTKVAGSKYAQHSEKLFEVDEIYMFKVKRKAHWKM